MFDPVIIAAIGSAVGVLVSLIPLLKAYIRGRNEARAIEKSVVDLNDAEEIASTLFALAKEQVSTQEKVRARNDLNRHLDSVLSKHTGSRSKYGPKVILPGSR